MHVQNGVIVRTSLISWAVGSLALCCALLLFPHNAMGQESMDKEITKAAYGTTPDRQDVDIYTLINANGMVAKITTFGGIVTELHVPDRDGELADIVLGFDTLDGYLEEHPYFGAIVGRYGNRIANGRFTLDGQTYTLAQNNNENHLHGGIEGFDKKVWEAETVERPGAVGLQLTYLSPDGEEGYPGNLVTQVTYWLSDDNALVIQYLAESDAATPVNLTNHSYFNLNGQGNGDILDHRVQIFADRYTPVNDTLIPTGELAPVAGTPFDFTEPESIGARINADHEQIEYGLGYDHNYVLNNDSGNLALAARVIAPETGRVMEVHTTEPGMQFYTGNFLDGAQVGKDDQVYEYRYGFCMETQHFPDSPNQENFPSTILRPWERYASTTIYAFKTE